MYIYVYITYIHICTYAYKMAHVLCGVQYSGKMLGKMLMCCVVCSTHELCGVQYSGKMLVLWKLIHECDIRCVCVWKLIGVCVCGTSYTSVTSGHLLVYQP